MLITVALVERSLAPQGIPLADSKAVAKRAANDLVELAIEIQKANLTPDFSYMLIQNM